MKLIYPAFSKTGKSLENRDQSGKKVKSLEFFAKLQPAGFICFFFVLVKSYSVSPVHLQSIMKKALFLHCLRTLLITYFDNLESGKRKSLKKSWILDPKICMNPVGNSSALQLHSFAEITILMCDEKPKAIWYSVKIAWDHKLYLLLINYNIQLRDVLLIVSKHYLLFITKGRKVFSLLSIKMLQRKVSLNDLQAVQYMYGMK